MTKQLIIQEVKVRNAILFLRGKRVILDADLADFYGTSTKRLNEQVKRNPDRFPAEFMFQLTKKEKEYVVANCDHLRKLKFSQYLPYAFTEHGAVMLASILNSQRAMEVNIQIVRVFIKMRELILSHKDLLIEMEEIRKKVANQDDKIELVFDYLTQFIAQQEQPNIRESIGFKPKRKY